ncbi:receptor-type guanylate cyclase gcy-4 isoform X2 [Apis florea]|uniref:receptor-type guanylate cyclase gcy-4 isoform X2 n=1 Tax=Apis florea TaxID=7463 RepID=UPI0012FE8F8A|nr:receptor-type guanylate cyclase gcy-4 isoform X2 [Apis florea]
MSVLLSSRTIVTRSWRTASGSLTSSRSLIEEKIKMLRFGSILGVLVFLTIAKIVISNRCLTMLEEVNPKRVIHLDGQPLNINFEVSRRVTQRLATIIMKIFLTEVLGYSKVSIYEVEDEFRAEETFSRLSDDLMFGSRLPMVNMEVWIPPQLDTMPLLNSHDVKECGSIAPPGHFGWFVPIALSRRSDSWIIFTELEKASRFEMDESTLESIRNFTIDPKTKTYYCQESYCQQGMYIPEWCQGKPCALLLTSYIDVTNFVKDHIDQMKLYVKVIWFGSNLKHVIKLAEKLLFDRNSSTSTDRSLVFLHWTPSTVIPNEREFVSIDFPRCSATNSEIGCKYESNRLTKLVWAKLEYAAKLAYEAINHAKFTREMYEDLINRRNDDLSRNEEEIACDWLRDNLNYTLNLWMPNTADKNILYVGGIFPMSETFYSGKAILVAAMLAKEAINVNNTILRDYNFTLLVNDGQCKSDMVMRSFIDYIVHNQYEKLVGVLGPACSETVEPLVGVSKHYKTVVISYSAEGSSFNDRTKYPYFFRTIGENKQYKHVYLQLLKKLGWKRVASLTEDGQKYTEYISYMQDLFRDNGIVFVANAKFPREREPIVMTKYLQDFKQKKAKIIIADVYDQAARQVMCNAYKLEMTAVQGYVWFLPLWLRPEWYDTDRYNQKGEQVPCTTAEMSKAINGYLGLSHAYFAPDNDIMQEGITVRQWRDRYELYCQKKNQPPSNYAGYAYDAMWTYAYAMDRLLRENQSYVFDLHSNHTINRLTDIIGETDFYGVSGRIKFFGGPSRYSVINIVQHINNETRLVGNFYPNVSEKQHEVSGGKLDLNVSSLVWLSRTMPDDGSEPPQRCVIGGFADFMNVSCEVAFVIVNIFGFSLLGIFLIIGFIIIKRRYERKVREQREYLKSMGISYACDDSSDLDKWEIPRHRVVINRKLGEGAFGTVYGGEAFFPEKGWLAVAVKTLKIGSTTEEKLDFLSEVEVMKQFDHKNIIKLLGVCIKSEPVLTVMEFMLYGDLKTYLLARRHLVNDNSYEDSDEISNRKLTAMALDVARALSYLAQSKYVHRDIASRNCLVNAQRVVKLGDFGMTRLMYENDYYKFNRRGMLPVRWMAPESLGLGIFTPASDVWSYGVLLYEIITFGSFPFQGMSNTEVLNHVKNGNSLMVPKGVKIQLENLMYSCWRLDHVKRPTAPEIVEFLATNPRILSPCLDVPLASVQIEHTGQLDIELPENLRKFSLSWPPQNSTTLTTSTSSPFGIPYPPLLDINDHDDKPTQNSIIGNGIADIESSRPLLMNANESSSDLPMILQSFKQKEESAHKYVNIQPGISTNCDYSSDQNGGNIQMEERRAILPENRKSEDVSIL